MFEAYTNDIVVYDVMYGANTRSFQKWILVFDHDMIYFMNKRTGDIQTCAKFDSKVLDVQVDRVTNQDLFVMTKDGVL
jgi:hypothetical protein